MKRNTYMTSLSRHRKQGNKAIRRAARGSRINARRKTPLVVIILLVVGVLGFFTLNDSLMHIDGIPTWSEMFRGTGLSGSAISTDSDVSVHFIDVGQGDSELIMTKTHAVLIDSGEKEYFSTVINYLKAQEISRLDYVIVTHPHSDHAGAMSYILSEFEIGTLIMPELPDDIIPTTSTYVRLLKAIESEKINVEYAEAGKSYKLDDATLTLLSPLAEYDDLNNFSVAAKFAHGENSFLFTGDIESEAEGNIMDSGANITADVLKVAHHGSSTSSKKSFIKKVAGQYAVIEVGSPNSYNHPNDKVVERLETAGYTIYRTDLHGCIIFESDGSSLNIVTEKEAG